MDELYFDLVIAKRRTCNPESVTARIKMVPSRHLEAVKALLREAGYDDDGNKLEN